MVADFSGRFRLPKRADNPFKMGYDPKLDIRPKFGSEDQAIFSSYCGSILLC